MVKSSHLRVHPWAALAFAGMLAFVAAVVGWSPPAHAAPTFTVIDPTDAPDAILNGQCASTFQGLCTLRAALQEAQHAGGGEVTGQEEPGGAGAHDDDVATGGRVALGAGDAGGVAGGVAAAVHLGLLCQRLLANTC